MKMMHRENAKSNRSAHRGRAVRRHRHVLALLAAVAGVAVADRVFAVDGTFKAGSGNWSAPGSWQTGGPANGIGATAIFPSDANSADVATVDGNFVVGNITVNNKSSTKNWDFNGTGTLTIDATGSANGNITINGDQTSMSNLFILNDTLATLGSGDLTLSGNISGVGGILVNSTAVTTLSGAGNNTFTGLTTVSAGTLTLSKTGVAIAVGSGGLNITGGAVLYGSTGTDNIKDTANVTLASGSFSMAGHSDTFSSLTVNGGTFSTGAATLTIGNLTVGGGTSTGLIALSGNYSGTSSATFGGNIALTAAAHTFDVAGSGNSVLSGNITGSPTSFTKTGSGSLSLTFATNGFSVGNITVAGGTLGFSGNGSLGAAANQILLKDGSALRYDGGTALALVRRINVDTAAGATVIIDTNGNNLSFNASGTRGIYGGSSTATIVKQGSFLMTLTNNPGDIQGTWRVDEGTLATSAAGDAGLGNSANDITLNGGAFGASSSTYTLSAGRVITLNAVAGNAIGSTDATGDMIVSGTNQITGAGGFTKGGSGTLTISGSNDFTGNVTVGAGALNIQNATATGTTAGGVAVSSGAALQIQGNISVGAETLTLNGTGLTSTGALRSISGNNSWDGGIVLGATGVRINSDTAGNTLTLNGGITGNGFGVTIGGVGNTTIATLGINTDGSGNITKDGTGTLFVTASGNYTGATAVTAGVLNIQNATATGATSGGVSVTSGAALQLQGNITVGAEALSINGTGVSNTGALRNISGNNTWGGSVALAATGVRINSDADTLTIGGSITGTGFGVTIGGAGNTSIASLGTFTAGNITKDGSGTLFITGAGNYTGATAVSQGVLNIQNNTATGTVAGGVSVASGAALQLQGNISVGAEALTLNGTGVSATGALRNIAGNNTWGGNISVGAAGTRINSDDNLLTLTGNITGTGFALTVGGAGNTTISTVGINTGAGGTLTKDGAGKLLVSANSTFTGGTTINNGSVQVGNGGTSGTLGSGTITNNTNTDLVFNRSDAFTIGNTINGSGGLQQVGSGSVSLTGNNGYTGDTVITSGKLLVNNTAGSATGTGNLSVASGATFGGNGTISGKVTTTDTTSVISAGNSPGNLTVGDFDGSAGARIKSELGTTDAVGVSDHLVITGQFTGSNAAGGLLLDIISWGFDPQGPKTGVTYTLVSFGSSVGLEDTDFSVVQLTNRLVLDTTFGSSDGGGNNDVFVDSGSVQIRFSAVPEPTSLSLLGLGAGGLLARRRRSRKVATKPV